MAILILMHMPAKTLSANRPPRSYRFWGPAARSYRFWGPLGTIWDLWGPSGDLWGPSFEEVIDSIHFELKYDMFSKTCIFNILEGHFSQGFFAEGRRDTQRVLVLIPTTQQMFPILILKKCFPY